MSLVCITVGNLLIESSFKFVEELKRFKICIFPGTAVQKPTALVAPTSPWTG